MAKTKKSLDEYSRVIMSTDDVIQLLLNKDTLDNVICGDNEERELFNKHSEDLLEREMHLASPDIDITVDEFHKKNLNDWMIPEEYLGIDVDTFLLEKCNTDAERERVKYEIKLYKEHEVAHLLYVFIYLVEVMRKNKIVWGVGRGSSVSSFCLYLIGVHKINSLKYDLDINEFLK